VEPTAHGNVKILDFGLAKGGGVRLPPRGLALFEAVINAVHKAAPGAAIAFNTVPQDSADAAARWLAAGSRAV